MITYDEGASLDNALARLHAAAAKNPALAYLVQVYPDRRAVRVADPRKLAVAIFELACFAAAQSAGVKDSALDLHELFPQPEPEIEPAPRDPNAPPMRPGDNIDWNEVNRDKRRQPLHQRYGTWVHRNLNPNEDAALRAYEEQQAGGVQEYIPPKK